MPDLHRSSPAELQEALAAERRGAPFLAFRDADGRQRLVDLSDMPATVTVGRRADNELSLSWDPEVSRVHAQLQRVGREWTVLDDGLSRNGSFVNGERVTHRRRLHDGDRLCFGETVVLFRSPMGEPSLPTASVAGRHRGIPVTPAQHRVLVALCRPVRESAYASPASNKDIAEEVCLSVDAVKAHLRVLFERFGLEALPQNQKRARLAATALVDGLVAERDF